MEVQKDGWWRDVEKINLVLIFLGGRDE